MALHQTLEVQAFPEYEEAFLTAQKDGRVLVLEKPDDVSGLRERLLRLTEPLAMGTEKQRIVTVTGIAGAGKTTLSKTVHEVMKLRSQDGVHTEELDTDYFIGTERGDLTARARRYDSMENYDRHICNAEQYRNAVRLVAGVKSKPGTVDFGVHYQQNKGGVFGPSEPRVVQADPKLIYSEGVVADDRTWDIARELSIPYTGLAIFGDPYFYATENALIRDVETGRIKPDPSSVEKRRQERLTELPFALIKVAKAMERATLVVDNRKMIEERVNRILSGQAAEPLRAAN